MTQQGNVDVMQSGFAGVARYSRSVCMEEEEKDHDDDVILIYKIIR